MFKWWGYIGIILMLFGEILIFYLIEPISTYTFFLFLWVGYILFIDALVFHRTKKSLLTTPRQFWLLFVLSSIFWWFYELLNIFVENWRYEGVGQPEWLMFTLAFSTVLPAILETSDLLSSFSFFNKFKFRMKITTRKISFFILLGLSCLILPFILPLYTYPLVWVSMFLLLDPINYLNKRKSILAEFRIGKPKLFFTLMLGTLICGFLWEFWNYWAPAKWYYDVPFVGAWKIFEMPVLGFLGYLPFGLSLFALYQFSLTFLRKK